MKNIFTLFLLIFVTLFPQEGICQYEDVFTQNGEETLSLNGEWHFQIDSAEKGIAKEWFTPQTELTHWDKMDVPGNWETKNEYAHYQGTAFYRQNFTTPGDWEGSQIRIKFGAVYERATVWLNGKKVGEHTGGYTPFEFNITPHVSFDKENTLVVMVDNHYHRGAWWPWGGISRPVTLIRNNTVRIVYQHIQSTPSLDTGTGQVEVRVMLENNGTLPVSGSLGSTISKWLPGDQEQPLNYYQNLPFTLNAKSTQVFYFSFIIEPSDVQLWHFDHPHLYSLKTTILQDDKLQHQKKERFGIRKIEVKGTKLLLNGEPVRLYGFNRVHDHRVWGNTEPGWLIRQDVDDMKVLGANFARMMHAPLAVNLLDYLDEKGFLVIQEIPVWGKNDPVAHPGNDRPKQWLKEMIQRDFNHPCIIGWSVSNELAGPETDWEKISMTVNQQQYVKNAMAYIKEALDSSRLNTFVSFTAFRKHVTPSHEPFDFADIICINTYGNAIQQAQTVHERWPGKPIFLAEIGKGQLGLDPDTAVLRRELLHSFEALGKMEYITGASLWTYNDYRSRYRATPASENRAWGVVNVWRQKKKAYHQVKKIFSPIQHLLVDINEGLPSHGKVEALLTLIPRDQQSMPAYALKGYKILCTIKDRTNNTKDSLVLDLPAIKPGSLAYKARFQLKYEKSHSQSLNVSLISSTGYQVHQFTHSFYPPRAPKIKKIIKGNGQVRVLFDQVEGATAYKCYYGHENAVQDTCISTNTYIDIRDLTIDKTYDLALVAINDKGESERSEVTSVKANGRSLPPVIWAEIPISNGFYVGYSVQDGDQSFDIQYGTQPGDYDVVKENIQLKGCYLIGDLTKGTTYYYRMRRMRNGQSSEWSEERKVTVL